MQPDRPARRDRHATGAIRAGSCQPAYIRNASVLIQDRRRLPLIGLGLSILWTHLAA